MRVLPLLDTIERYHAHKRNPPMELGFDDPWLSEVVGSPGFGPPIVVAARPNVGKSFFALRLAAAFRGPSAFLSLEDSLIEVGRRAQGVPAHARARMTVAAPSFPSLDHILATMDTVADAGCKLVVVDYLQLIGYTGDVQVFSHTQQIALTIQHLMARARDREMVLVLNAQVKRPGQDGAHRPGLYDLADSSAIEKAAWKVIMLHATADEPAMVEAYVAKSKDSPVGSSQWFERTSPHGWLVPCAAPAAPVEESHGSDDNPWS